MGIEVSESFQPHAGPPYTISELAYLGFTYLDTVFEVFIFVPAIYLIYTRVSPKKETASWKEMALLTLVPVTMLIVYTFIVSVIGIN